MHEVLNWSEHLCQSQTFILVMKSANSNFPDGTWHGVNNLLTTKLQLWLMFQKCRSWWVDQCVRSYKCVKWLMMVPSGGVGTCYGLCSCDVQIIEPSH